MGRIRNRNRLDRALAALAEGDAAGHAGLLRPSDLDRAVRRQIVLERRRPASAEARADAFERGFAHGLAGLAPRPPVLSGGPRTSYLLGYVAGELTAL